MTDELIAYLMDDLSPERRAAVEDKLATEFTWQRELKRLQECLAAGGDPTKCAEEPPPDLVQKTCFLVEHSDDRPAPKRNACRGAAPIAAFTADAPCAAASRPWSVVDLAIGGGVLLLVGFLVTPALFETRNAARRSLCQRNLEQLGQALFDYQEARDHRLPAVQPGESAGVYVVELLEDGRLTREELAALVVCPESPLADEVFAGRVKLELPNRNQWRQARGAKRERLMQFTGGSLAYKLGHFDGPEYRQPRFTGEQGLPLVADAPMYSPAGVRSGNHPRGHNVLYESLAVGFRTDCVLANPRDNFYLNADGQPAAGRDADDIVLGSSAISPDGPLAPIEE